MNNYSAISQDPLILMVNNSLLGLPTPYSISFIWNIGFLLGITLILQVVTGLLLSINYISSVDLAFSSVVHIIRDVDSGHYMRYSHINGASLFFILLYAHISRGLYFNSPNSIPIVWFSGIIILLASIGAAFIGYVLPWGQISFWGATVITSILSAVPYLGGDLTQWLWGNFSVSQPTLNRFFSLHFILPMLIIAAVVSHLIFLHNNGSSNPSGLDPHMDNIKFFPFFAVNDIIPLFLIFFIISLVVTLSPDLLGDVENFNQASIAVTPPHIQPEWYFLFAYAILRSIPSNLGGVIAIVGSILILLTPTVNNENTNNNFSPNNNILFWCFIVVVVLLSWVGANPVEAPFVSIGQVLTFIYFYLVLIL